MLKAVWEDCRKLRQWLKSSKVQAAAEEIQAAEQTAKYRVEIIQEEFNCRLRDTELIRAETS